MVSFGVAPTGYSLLPAAAVSVNSASVHGPVAGRAEVAGAAELADPDPDGFVDGAAVGLGPPTVGRYGCAAVPSEAAELVALGNGWSPAREVSPLAQARTLTSATTRTPIAASRRRQ